MAREKVDYGAPALDASLYSEQCQLIEEYQALLSKVFESTGLLGVAPGHAASEFNLNEIITPKAVQTLDENGKEKVISFAGNPPFQIYLFSANWKDPDDIFTKTRLRALGVTAGGDPFVCGIIYDGESMNNAKVVLDERRHLSLAPAIVTKIEIRDYSEEYIWKIFCNFIDRVRAMRDLAARLEK